MPSMWRPEVSHERWRLVAQRWVVSSINDARRAHGHRWFLIFQMRERRKYVALPRVWFIRTEITRG